MAINSLSDIQWLLILFEVFNGYSINSLSDIQWLLILYQTFNSY